MPLDYQPRLIALHPELRGPQDRELPNGRTLHYDEMDGEEFMDILTKLRDIRRPLDAGVFRLPLHSVPAGFVVDSAFPSVSFSISLA